jgi:hypothetical protein
MKRPQTSIPTLRTKRGEWAKSVAQKANVLADLFANVFKPYTSEMPEEQEREILRALGTPGRLETPVKKFKVTEVRSAIQQLLSRKAPGYDLITGKILKDIPDIGIRAITQILNSVLRSGYFLDQWKVS